VFKIDTEYQENEEKYKEIKSELIGDADSDGSKSSDSGSDDASDSSEGRSLSWLTLAACKLVCGRSLPITLVFTCCSFFPCINLWHLFSRKFEGLQ